MKWTNYLANASRLTEYDLDPTTDLTHRWDFISAYHRLRRDAKKEVLKTALSNAMLARIVCHCLMSKTSLSCAEWQFILHIASYPATYYGEETDEVQEEMLRVLDGVATVPDWVEEELKYAEFHNSYLQAAFKRAGHLRT